MTVSHDPYDGMSLFQIEPQCFSEHGVVIGD
jgi:hypothetical protein